MEENLADYYYNKLNDPNVGLTLSKFYSELFGRTLDKNTIIMFNRAVKLFGRFTVYFSILDLYGMENKIDFSNGIFPLLMYFCKKRTEQKYGTVTITPYIELSGLISSLEKKIKKLNK